MARFTHTIDIDCDPKDEKLIKAILDKYAFKGDGVKKIDDAMNNYNFITTPAIKGMVIKKLT